MEAPALPLLTKAAAQQKSRARPSQAEAEEAVRTLLAYIGEDPEREGLLDTPKRVVKAYGELFGGYEQDTDALLKRQFEDVGGYKSIVLVRDIPFFSHCEHHIVPFIGKAHIGYHPKNGVVGLSKIARVVDIFARRLQTQENLTAEVANALYEGLDCLGVAVMMEAEHMCMTMRGVQKSGVSTVTTHFTGVFGEKVEEQVRFISMARGGA